MFRSGTTLMGRVLHAHPNLGIASDPFRPVYNSLRSHVANEVGVEVAPDRPLDDYYLDPEGRRVFKALQEANLDVPIQEDLGELRSRIADHGRPFSPRIADRVDDLEGSTFSELFDSMVELSGEAYGPEDAEAVGFKEVWTDEFTPLLCRSRQDVRVVHVVRDPRAVAASKNVTDGKYPWWFLARQWRKLAALSWAYARDETLSERVHTIRFEDFLREPKEQARNLCDFLGVNFAPAMTDPSTYVDGSGDPWRQNTNYGEGKKDFETDAIDRWRSTLAENEIRYMEALCAPEMHLHGYETETSPSPPAPLDSPQIPQEEIAGWMRGTIPNDSMTTATLAAEEAIRYDVLSARNPPKEVVEGAFLRRDIYEAAAKSYSDVVR